MNVTAIVATIIETECRFTDEMTPEEIIKEAMAKARNNWMDSTESQRFDAAIAIAYTKMSDHGKARMKKTTDLLKAINAAASGVPVDMMAALTKDPDVEPLPLRELWEAARNEK